MPNSTIQTLDPGKEPIPVWAVSGNFEPCRAWAFFSEKRQGWAVYDGEGFALPNLGCRIGWASQLPDGVFQTRELAVDAALDGAVAELNRLEPDLKERLRRRKAELQDRIARLEGEAVNLG